MKRKLVLLLIAALIIIPFTTAFALNSTEEQIRDRLQEMANDLRREKGLQEMRMDTDLQAFAQEWAEIMKNTGKFEHRQSSELREFMQQHKYQSIGENIAYRAASNNPKQIAEGMMEAWIKSPGHYANLTDPKFNVTGIGVAQNGNEYYACQNFGQNPLVTGGVVTPGNSDENENEISPDTTDKAPVPGLNYSEKETGDAATKRAVVGPRCVIEGRNDALNAAARVVTKQTGTNKYRFDLVDQSGNTVKTKGLVKVYMYIEPSVKRPFRVKVDGIVTQFADVEGTNYVWFATEK